MSQPSSVVAETAAKLPTDIESFLRDAQLDKLKDIFEKHEIDKESLLELTEGDLIEMGVVIGPRRKLLARIRRLKTLMGVESPLRSTHKRDGSASISYDSEILRFSGNGTLREGGVKVIILIGGPSKGTRFRPLSMETPKPLFPVAGKPLIWHHIRAATKIPDLSEVILIGFYDINEVWKSFIIQAEAELGVQIRYLKESSGRLGTAGGLKFFKDQILEGNPEQLIVMHSDICCTFPLIELLSFHKSTGKECTILGKKVSPKDAHKYGCLAIESNTKEVLHYAEKPETFISDIINGGIYAFSPTIYGLIDKVSALAHSKSLVDHPDHDPNYLRLEQDLFMNICGEKHVYVYETQDFWLQIKSAGAVVKCTEDILAQIRGHSSHLLARSGDGKSSPQIVGNVLIDGSAFIHPSAKLGPNVTIGANVAIGAGVRIKNSIILNDAEIKDHACVQYAIVGWQSSVGKWSRLEGQPDYTVDIPGITILGRGVNVASEIVVHSSIVLPHKDLGSDTKNQIVL